MSTTQMLSFLLLTVAWAGVSGEEEAGKKGVEKRGIVHESAAYNTVPVETVEYVNRFPVLQPVPVAHPVPVPFPVGVPHPVPVPHPVEVPVYKTVKVPVDKPVPYTVEKPYPVEVIHKIPVPVHKPYPVPYTILKTKVHIREWPAKQWW